MVTTDRKCIQSQPLASQERRSAASSRSCAAWLRPLAALPAAAHPLAALLRRGGGPLCWGRAKLHVYFRHVQRNDLRLAAQQISQAGPRASQVPC